MTTCDCRKAPGVVDSTVIHFVLHLLDLGEQVLLSVVVDDLANRLLLEGRVVVLEAGGLDGASVHRKWVIVQQLGIQVGSQWRVGDARPLAEIRPRLQMLVVHLLSHGLDRELLAHQIRERKQVEEKDDGNETESKKKKNSKQII